MSQDVRSLYFMGVCFLEFEFSELFFHLYITGNEVPGLFVGVCPGCEVSDLFGCVPQCEV